MFLKILQNSQKNTCAKVSFLINLQAEFCEMFKDIFIAEHLRMTASESFGNIKVNLNGYIGYIHLSSLCLLISQEESFCNGSQRLLSCCWKNGWVELSNI